MAKEVQHLAGRPDRRQRVRLLLARDVGRRAMDGLEHGRELALRVEVCTGRQAHAARDRSAQVGQDIAEQVRGDDNLKSLRILDKEHAGRVHQQRVGLHVRILLAHLGKDLIPEYHRIVECIALADAGQALALTARQLIGIADDALGALAGEHAGLQNDLVGLILVQPCARAGILALAVLADDDHVDIALLAACKRAGRAVQQLDRAHVDVLVKIVADAQQQIPERDVVGHARRADCTQIDRVELFELLDAVVVHHLAGLQIILTAPREVGELKGKGAVQLCDLIEHLDALGQHFRANAIACDDCNLIRLHSLFLSFLGSQSSGKASAAWRRARTTGSSSPVRKRMSAPPPVQI